MTFFPIVKITAVCLFLISIIPVVLRRGLSSYIRPFFFFVLVNLCGMIAIELEMSGSPLGWNWGYKFLYAHIAFLPAAWFYLTSRWAIDKQEVTPLIKKLSYAFGLVSLAVFLHFLFKGGIDVTINGDRWFLDLGGLSLYIAAYHVVGFTAGLYSLETCYRSSLGMARDKIRPAFLPLLACGVGYLAVATVMLLYKGVTDIMLIVTYLLAGLAMASLARHYFRFKPVDDGIILTRKGIYSSISVVIIGIYLVIIGFFSELLIELRLDDGLIISLVMLIILVFTFSMLVGSQARQTRRELGNSSVALHGGGKYAAEWKEFAEEISVLLNIEGIYNQTADLMRRLIRVDQNIFVIREAAPSNNYTIYAGDDIDRGIPGRKLEKLSAWLYRGGKAAEVETLREKAPEEWAELNDLEQKLPFRPKIIVPLIARQKLLGFWGIGNHIGGGELTSEEIGFIEAVASPVSLTILGARITDELVVSREIESFHKISSFVLHDLKNSVGMLSMLLQNAEKNMDNPEFQKSALVTIAKAVDRQKKIISRLTDQQTDEKLSLTATNLTDLIRRVLDRIRLDTVKNIELDLKIAENFKVAADPDKLASVFENLLMNAVEAMPSGGCITISTEKAGREGEIAVSFADTGPGMDEEFIATRLYKPFSSTKPHGLGIGMYQSREIVAAHQGRLEVTSSPGEGSIFVIYLPGESIK